LSFAPVIAGGLEHTCGVTTGGSAYCWGDNDHGQLGDGTTVDRTTPVPVANGLSFASLTAGGGHTCGLTTAGTAYCWGYNFAGQLGDGTTVDRTTPRESQRETAERAQLEKAASPDSMRHEGRDGPVTEEYDY
jgi:alpha-tubulin suppressor-like RCC1 family protein